MGRFPLDEMEEKVGSKFSAVVAIAKRAIRASQSTAGVPSDRRPNPLRAAMEDIISGRIKVVGSDEAPQKQPEEEKQEE